MKRRKKTRSPWRMAVYAMLCVGSVAMLFPFYWLVRSSFMTSVEIFMVPMRLLPTVPRFSNYSQALTSIPFFTYLSNSVLLVALNMLGNLFSSSFCAFGYARLKFPGRNIWFFILLSTMMIPGAVVLIPQFIGWNALHAYNTYWPLALPSFFGSAFYIFLMRQFYMGIPMDYDEAARIDGANYMQIYLRLLLPMSKPALTTVGVFTFMNTWNDFFGPLIYLNSESRRTLALGLFDFMGKYKSEWHLLMAASTVVTLPMVIMFFFAQRYFIEGLNFSGLKG